MGNWKIGWRLGGGFGIVLALLAGLTTVALYSLSLAGQEQQRMVEMERRAMLADEWLQNTNLNINRVMALAKSGNHAEVDAYFKPLIAQTSERINALQSDLEKSIESAQGKALLEGITARRKEYIDVRKAYFSTLASGDVDKAGAMLQNGLVPAVERYMGAMEALRKLQHGLVDQAVTDSREELKTESWALLGIALVAVALGIVIAWWITRSVTTPLREAVGVAETVARGDLTHSVQTRRLDELGDLLRALGSMRESLFKTVVQVRSATENIGTASTQIASGNQDLSSRTEQTASNLQQTAASMEELNSTVRQSAEAARQANQLAASAAETAARGGQVVSQVVSTMEAINHSSKKISDIIGVI
ncbi:MCP four helix bundle domain-containing protein, partial [Hydrogenophaga electricum]|uniref:MCP four helix bundle domain-containing protein n=1 Tax=Hydrogenophaga electricum TaxID=1230953 RepID=UPI0024E06AF4